MKRANVHFSFNWIVLPALALLVSAPDIRAQRLTIYSAGHYPGGNWAEPRDINNNDVVVGYGDIGGTPSYTRPIGLPVSGQNAGRWFDLGTLGGDRTGMDVMCMAVANSGLIVGHSATAQNVVHAFAWNGPSGMIDIGTLPGHTYSLAYGTNKAGTLVAGFSGTGLFTADALPVVWMSPSAASPSWKIQKLDTTGFENLAYWTAMFMNNAGQIVGAAGNGLTLGYKPFVWTPKDGSWKISKLPVLSDSNSVPYASNFPYAYPNRINSSGQIAGSLVLADGSVHLPAVWLPDPRTNSWTLAILPTLWHTPYGFGVGEAMGINDRGDIVGYSSPDGLTAVPTLWNVKDLSSIRRLDFPGQRAFAFGVAVNDKGVVAIANSAANPFAPKVQEDVVVIRID